MQKSFDQWAKELQELILEEDRKIFSPQVIDNYLKPKNLKQISDSDGKATLTGPCGDTMYIALKLNGDKIVEIGFLTDGCGPTVACGSMVTQMAVGRTLVEAVALGKEDLLRALGGLPESHLHCAKLAVDTLQETLRDCEDRGGE
ncbi:iron-sulfur cluster assembly scaffold protein [Candidatus Zixiibacteriota bacterium]